MVKPAEARQSNDLGGWMRLRLDDSHRGRVLLQGQVRPVVEVVRGEAGQKALQVFLVEDDDVIQEIAACGADEPLGDSVLPRTARRDLLRFDAQAPNCGGDLVAVFAVTVADQVARHLIVGECLAKLLGNSSRRLMLGDTDVDQHASRVMDDKECVEHAERGGGDREAVDHGDDLAVVGEKGVAGQRLFGASGLRRSPSVDDLAGQYT